MIFVQPTRNEGRAILLLLDFAPDEVYLAKPVARFAVGSYPTISPLPDITRGQALESAFANLQDPFHRKMCPAVYFLWPFLSPYGARGLPGVMLSGARTFLRR